MVFPIPKSGFLLFSILKKLHLDSLNRRNMFVSTFQVDSKIASDIALSVWKQVVCIEPQWNLKPGAKCELSEVRCDHIIHFYIWEFRILRLEHNIEVIWI